MPLKLPASGVAQGMAAWQVQKLQSSDKCLGCSASTAVISKTLLLPKIRHLNLFLSSSDLQLATEQACSSQKTDLLQGPNLAIDRAKGKQRA